MSSSYREFTQFFPQPGWVEHDANEIWAAIQVILAELKTALDAAGETIAAIGITDQRETIVAWDRSTGQPRHRAIVWQDRRTADYCAQLESDGALDLVRSTTGLVLDPYFSGTKAHWLFTEGGVTPDDSVALGTIDSWLIWKLTDGTAHITDATNASRTMLFDIRSGEWSEELCELLGVPRHVLPQVVPSSGRVAVTASSCALGPGIPISGIAGDQQASLFGQACFAPGMAKNTYGTGSFVLMNMGTECPAPVEGLLTTIAWSLPTESGSPQLTYARGTILGITRGTTAAHIARAMLESIALQTRDDVDAMTNAGGLTLQSLRADGGAASDFVLQLQADQLGVPVHRPTVPETTALGAAYLAGLAEGFWDSLDDIAENWAIDITIEPSSDRSMIERDHQQWLRAVARSRGWAKESTGD